MAPKLCCCGCYLGDDNFDRADSSDPGPKWHIVSGTGAIVSNTIEVDGNVATKICHPPQYEYGSWIVHMKLVGLRTWDYHEIGAGDPTSSPYRIQWVPSGMDTGSPIITIRIHDGTEWHEFEQTWNNLDELEVTCCYQPGAMIRAMAGPDPWLDVCIPLSPHDYCYEDEGEVIGNFFFTYGKFDNWTYEATIIDDILCNPCGCFCYLYYPEDDIEEWNCYPRELTLHLELQTGDCAELDTLTYTLTQGQVAPSATYPQKLAWFSANPLTCSETGTTYTFKATCVPIESGDGYFFLGLALTICAVDYVDSSVVFQWVEPAGIGYVSATTRYPDPTVSRCDPLNLVYPDMKIQSFTGPCLFGGSIITGYFPFCCGVTGPASCYDTPPDIRFKVRITE